MKYEVVFIQIYFEYSLGKVTDYIFKEGKKGLYEVFEVFVTGDKGRVL